MPIKRADELVVGDVLVDEREVAQVAVLSRGDIGVRFVGEATPFRYGPAYRFLVDDATIDWQRVALRRLWNHTNATVRNACRTVITATRAEAGL